MSHAEAEGLAVRCTRCNGTGTVQGATEANGYLEMASWPCERGCNARALRSASSGTEIGVQNG